MYAIDAGRAKCHTNHVNNLGADTMKITVEFDSEAEFEAFKTSGKKTRSRGGKDDSADNAGDANAATGQAPAPMQPGGAGAPSFGNQPQFTAPQGFAPGAPVGGFPTGAATVDPNVAALVTRVTAAVDRAIGSGQPAEAVRNWFAQELVKGGVAEAANATMDQIKQQLLFKLPVPALEQIAKLMNA